MMTSKPVAFFDLDGTLRDTYHALYPRAADVVIFPEVTERLQALRSAGFLLIGVTNQGGVSRGIIRREEVEAANARTQQLLRAVPLDAIFYCPHYRDVDGHDCDCKKPACGMLLNALSEFPEATLEGAFLVGDAPQDRGAADVLELRFLAAEEFRAKPIAELRAWALTPPLRSYGQPDPDKLAGTLVGLAVGDALGAPLEFLTRDTVRARYPLGLRELVASGRWVLGEYTDDTEMALLLADSLLAQGRLESRDAAARFQRWARTAKDVGVQTASVLQMTGYLESPEECARRYYESHADRSAGNGAVMRCAPVTLFRLSEPSMLLADSRRSARLTHADPRAQSSCVLLNFWIAEAILHGTRDARRSALQRLTSWERDCWQRLERIEELPERAIKSGGFTIDTVEAAAWSFLTTECFEEAVVRAANLGDDADTVAAVTGALAGAYYGYHEIPKRWLAVLRDEGRIRQTAIALNNLGEVAQRDAVVCRGQCQAS
jgi:ADP-ribosyl-[dinitrogen reductase] hydrolase